MKFIVLCVLLAVSPSVSANEATPIGKVVELLDDIKAQIDAAGKKEGQLFDKFLSWCHNEIRVAEQTIEDKTSEVSELKSALEQEEAFRDGKQMEMEKQIAELTQNEAELKDGTEKRTAEHKSYLKTEETLVSSIDALERSIVVLQKEQPNSASPNVGASLLASSSNTGVASAFEAPNLVAVASNLRKQLEHSSDLRLSPRQQEILDNLYRAAVDAQPGNAPSFLQTNQGGPYESKTGGVTSTLQDILDTTKTNRQQAMEAEKLAQNTFDTFEKALNMQIKSGKENLSEIKNQIARSQEVSSQKEASLRDAEEILKATQEQLAEVQAQQKSTTANYMEREKKRTEELKTMQDAIQILTSDAAKHFKTLQAVGNDSDDSDDAPPTFLQTQREQQVARRQAINVIRSASRPGVVLLALRSQLHHRSRDPFGKAKEMIRQMLEKLLAEANEEAEHNAWCVAEMAKSEKSKKDKEKTVQKLQDRVDAMDAEIQTLGDDLQNLQTELSDMADALTQATKLRNEERAAAKVAIKDYSDAQKLLKNALTVLQEFYGTESDGGAFDDAVPASSASAALVQQAPMPDVPKGEYKSRTRQASGVIGILEVAVEDFKAQEQEATMNENAAQQAYEQLDKESEVKRAVFLKDTEYKTRRKVKLEGDKARTSSDLRSYEKELSAVNDYIEKLKPSCTYSGDVYEERKRRREAELQSLQNALEVLNGQAVA